ncbi:MAG: hypothetical protein DRP78_02950, partial [Candidatus Omnitrophota bacterium]
VFEKGQAEDIYMSSIKDSVRKELVEYFGMDAQKAETIVSGIVRSEMTYERELISYQPTIEDISNVLNIDVAADKTSTLILPDASMGGEDNLAVKIQKQKTLDQEIVAALNSSI